MKASSPKNTAGSDSGRRSQTGGSSSGQKPQDEKSRTPNSTTDEPQPAAKESSTSETKDATQESQGERNSHKEERREREGEQQKASTAKVAKTVPTVKQEMEATSAVQSLKNDGIIAGLALQRLCDEKPDIDNLATSLMQLYYNIQFKNGESEGHRDLLDRIVLSALRVKSKMESHINRASWRVKAMLHYARRVTLKRKCLKKNAPRIEKNFVTMCRSRLMNKSFNELYDRLNKVLCKIPTLAQLEARAQQLRAQQTTIVGNIESLKRQIEAQKSQLENMCKIMSQSLNT